MLMFVFGPVLVVEEGHEIVSVEPGSRPGLRPGLRLAG